MNEPNLLKREDKDIRQQRKILITILMFVIVLFIGISYSLLTNYDETDEVITFTTGNLNMEVISEEYTLSDEIPKSDKDGLNNRIITITLKNTGKLPIGKYEVKLIESEEENKVSTLEEKYVKYAVSENSATGYSNGEFVIRNNNIIYTGYDLGVGESKTIYLKVWVDEEAKGEVLSKVYYGSIEVELYQRELTLYEEFKPIVDNKIKEHEEDETKPNIAITDIDDTIYLSGTNEDINFNYVWYSGKLWRITALYPDGRMKLIAEEHITATTFGATSTFANSWLYQWLNEDFLDTLENYEKVIDVDANWNNTTGATTTIPENTVMVKGAVGLLTAYEYSKGYQNTTTATTYLNTNTRWFTLTPYNATQMNRINEVGTFGVDNSYGRIEIRPSVYLKNNIHKLTGDGSKERPYTIKESNPKKIDKGTTKLNERISGEYLKFNNQIWRIVNTEEKDENTDKILITKIVLENYIRNDNGTILTKRYSNNITYGTTTSDIYWDYYLNNVWLNSINNNYRKMMTPSTYYQGIFNAKSYKAAICATADDNITTKECEKTTSTWTGYVGLPRLGDMFSGQYKTDTYSYFWLITPETSANITFLASNGGSAATAANGTTAYAARPTITLKSDVVIIDGEGTKEDPFEIECDTCTLDDAFKENS